MLSFSGEVFMLIVGLFSGGSKGWNQSEFKQTAETETTISLNSLERFHEIRAADSKRLERWREA